MATTSNANVVQPPKVFESLQVGFDQTARNLNLVLFPVLLDLLLWLAPQLRVTKLFQSFMEPWIASINRIGTPELQVFFTENRQGLQEFFDQYNLLTVFRTFPIGIPSLQASNLHLQSPLGDIIAFEIPDNLTILIFLVSLLVGGLVMGAIYFAFVARVYIVGVDNAVIQPLFKQVLNTFTLIMILIFILIAISIPALIIFSIVGVISGGLAQFVGMVFIFIMIWFLMPLIFAAHGIYLLGQNAVISLLTSVSLVRIFMPGTGLFLIVSLVVNEGLNIIWQIPSTQSWMTAVGIFGHAFIATSLLSASFAYYQSGMRWMNEAILRSAKTTSTAA